MSETVVEAEVVDLQERFEFDEDPPEATTEAEKAEEYRSLLEIWRELLRPAEAEAAEAITPQWASRIVQNYPELTYKSTVEVHNLFYELVMSAEAVVQEVIEKDPEALKVESAEEDRTRNRQHYLDILALWHKDILFRELEWTPVADNAAEMLGAIGEFHQMFFGSTGISNFLDNIQFGITEEEQQGIADALVEFRKEHDE